MRRHSFGAVLRDLQVDVVCCQSILVRMQARTSQGNMEATFDAGWLAAG